MRNWPTSDGRISACRLALMAQLSDGITSWNKVIIPTGAGGRVACGARAGGLRILLRVRKPRRHQRMSVPATACRRLDSSSTGVPRRCVTAISRRWFKTDIGMRFLRGTFFQAGRADDALLAITQGLPLLIVGCRFSRVRRRLWCTRTAWFTRSRISTGSPTGAACRFFLDGWKSTRIWTNATRGSARPRNHRPPKRGRHRHHRKAVLPDYNEQALWPRDARSPRITLSCRLRGRLWWNRCSARVP